jgi:hypothetical protein
MKLLDLSACLIIGYVILTGFLGSFVVHFQLDGKPPWTRGDGLKTHASAAANTTTAVNDTLKITTPITTRFFPTYGTREFFQQCRWTARRQTNNNCTILARPNPQTHEGISNHFAEIVSGHMLAQQKGCLFYSDYGPDVDIEKVVTPFPVIEAEPAQDGGYSYQPHQWIPPPDFDCQKRQQCFLTQADYQNGVSLQRLQQELGHLSQIPSYRFAYQNFKHYQLNASTFREIQQTLPGFKVETGMACSLASLFHLSPSATKFEPLLFTKILPTLHQPDTLVMALYVRTGRTDHVAGMKDKPGGVPAEDASRAQYGAKKIIQCAERLEQEYLANKSYSRIVWYLATDSTVLKQWLPASYDTRANKTVDIPRQVVTTRSRGAHTRPNLGPSTEDFAEGLIDWYLIGESDLVITDTNSPSFGGTAALRTARPLYKVPMLGDGIKCTLQTLVHY